MAKRKMMKAALAALLLSIAISVSHAYADDYFNTATSAEPTVEEASLAEVSSTDTDSSVAESAATEDASLASSEAADDSLVAQATASDATEAADTESADDNGSSTDADDVVTIIHTNDVHGRMQESSGVIGDAKLATIVEETRSQGTTLVFDSGDVFQGLPISNSSEGEDMAEILNAIGFDAMTLGNHEFDFGLEQLKTLSEKLTFPIISSNVYVDGARLFQASTIIDKDTTVEGDEFVVIGVTTPETATKTHPKNIVGVTFTDPITEVNNVIAQVEANAAAEGKTYNRYVILAHLGVDTTTPTEWQGTTLAQALSENELLTGKTVIVLDGHSHTVLTATYGNVTYNQTGSYLNNVGIVKLNSTEVLSAGVITAEEAQNITPNPEVAALIAEIEKKYEEENSVVIVEESPVELNGDRMNVRVRETNLGNAVADALLDYGQTGFTHKSNLAVTNGGGLRETISEGQAITKGDVIAVLPFGNIISQIEVTGQDIYDMFVTSLGSITQVDEDGNTVLDENGQPLLEPSGGFLQVAGVHVYYDTALSVSERILYIDVWDPETDTYKELDLTATYYLATNDFLAAGGDSYTMLGGAREEGPSLDTVFAAYLQTADLTQYATINPNARTISISSTLDSDGDGYADYLELISGTSVTDANDYPGKADSQLPDEETSEQVEVPTVFPARIFRLRYQLHLSNQKRYLYQNQFLTKHQTVIYRRRVKMTQPLLSYKVWGHKDLHFRYLP